MLKISQIDGLREELDSFLPIEGNESEENQQEESN